MQRQQRAAGARGALHTALARAGAEAVDSHSGKRLAPGGARTAVEAAELRAHALEAARLRMLRLQGQLARSLAAGKVMHCGPHHSNHHIKPCRVPRLSQWQRYGVG